MRKNGKKEVLVVGAGVAGLTAAARLAGNGVTVHLVEKEATPGGWTAVYGCKAADACVKCSVCAAQEKLEAARKDPRVRFHLNSTVDSLERKNSKFTARLTGGSRPLQADAVLIASGFKPYDAIHKGEYGWKMYPDVITGLQAEEMLLEKGEILKPSDGKIPEKVAFIQCVGSRYAQFEGDAHPAHVRTYCSTVCCAYALRMANLLVKRDPPAGATIFYMDLQNYGKGFNTLLNGCRDGVRFVRTIPSGVEEGPSGGLQVTYESLEEGRVIDEEFDLVVLSVGMAPRDDAPALAKTVNLREDEHGFFDPAHPDDATLTGQAGVFTAGACVAPKTIAASIREAEKAADNILKYLK